MEEDKEEETPNITNKSITIAEDSQDHIDIPRSLYQFTINDKFKECHKPSPKKCQIYNINNSEN